MGGKDPGPTKARRASAGEHQGSEEAVGGWVGEHPPIEARGGGPLLFLIPIIYSFLFSATF